MRGTRFVRVGYTVRGCEHGETSDRTCHCLFTTAAGGGCVVRQWRARRRAQSIVQGVRQGQPAAPREMRAHHHPVLPGYALQPDHHAQSAEPAEAGGRRPRGPRLLPISQSQLQSRPAVFPVQRLRARLHRSRVRHPSVPLVVPVG